MPISKTQIFVNRWFICHFFTKNNIIKGSKGIIDASCMQVDVYLSAPYYTEKVAKYLLTLISYYSAGLKSIVRIILSVLSTTTLIFCPSLYLLLVAVPASS